MDAAVAALKSNGVVSDTTILVGRNGAIRVIDGAAWPLDSLQAEYGASAAYRVSNGRGGVCVEGRTDGLTFALRSMQPGAAARLLLGGLSGHRFLAN